MYLDERLNLRFPVRKGGSEFTDVDVFGPRAIVRCPLKIESSRVCDKIDDRSIHDGIPDDNLKS